MAEIFFARFNDVVAGAGAFSSYHRPVSCPLSSRQFQRRGEEEEEEGGERDEG